MSERTLRALLLPVPVTQYRRHRLHTFNGVYSSISAGSKSVGDTPLVIAACCGQYSRTHGVGMSLHFADMINKYAFTLPVQVLPRDFSRLLSVLATDVHANLSFSSVHSRPVERCKQWLLSFTGPVSFLAAPIGEIIANGVFSRVLRKLLDVCLCKRTFVWVFKLSERVSCVSGHDILTDTQRQQ